MSQEGAAEQDLVGAVYEAALCPELWEGVLAGIERRVQAESSILFLEDLQNLRASFEISRGLDPVRMEDYYRHYINLDPMFAYRMERPVGTVTASHQVMSEGEFLRSEYYQDWYRHLDGFYSAGGVIARENGRVAVLGVQRAQSAGPFQEQELDELRALLPHLGRAFQIGRQLAGGEAQRQAVLVVLEQLPTGVLLLDETARVVYVNRRAQAILAAQDGLTIRPQGLTALNPEVDAQLTALIAGAVRTGSQAGDAAPAGGALLVPGPRGKEGYHLLVTPLRTERMRLDLGRERICAALFVQFEGSAPSLSQEVLRDLFGLTAAEARVAVSLALGRNPEEIAAAGEISRHTVRAQLSSIYDKMGVNRQAEVVRRVLNSPAVLDATDSRGKR